MIKVRNAWEPHELEIMRELYPKLGAQEVSNYLPKRSPRSCEQKAFDLGLHVLDDVKRKRLSDRAKAQNNLHRGYPVESLPDEYIQAADIFQVGYRVANVMGVVHEYAN